MLVLCSISCTFDEVSHLDLDRPLLQILYNHVGYPGQVTHVPSPSSALGSVIDRWERCTPTMKFDRKATVCRLGLR